MRRRQEAAPARIGRRGELRVEVRGDRQGEVIFRDNLADSVSAVLQADYRSDGREEVIACGYDGEVGAAFAPAEHTRVLCSPRLFSPPVPLPGFTRWVSSRSPPRAPAGATHGASLRRWLARCRSYQRVNGRVSSQLGHRAQPGTSPAGARQLHELSKPLLAGSTQVVCVCCVVAPPPARRRCGDTYRRIRRRRARR
jgi:hypothetical protein